MFLNDNLKIFSGSGNAELARAVCKYLEIPLGGDQRAGLLMSIS
jgi:phosphoribosylpyrophosphate synthetase